MQVMRLRAGLNLVRVLLIGAMPGLSADVRRADWALAFQSHPLKIPFKMVGQGKGEGDRGDLPST